MTNQAPLIHLTIDGKEVTVPKGTTVYHAAKNHEIHLPIFCYHDRMPPFGACRVCLVEVDKMGKLQTSCTLEATEGMVVKTQSQLAIEGRKGILEFLLINHPLDCPICDRGGECPLQDQALEHGPGESRFFEEKRHFTKAHPLGPVLMLDRERCIACARCTRFGDEVAGDHALEFIDRGYKTEVGTPSGGPAESKFIGNTIMICPVGALTSQVYRFKARPWDNRATHSTCTLCPVGCSMILDERDGDVVRTRSCENKDVNDVWLCDKGWFGYEFVDSHKRLQKPLIRKNGELVPTSWDEALTLIANKIKEAKPRGKLAAFGGNPLSVEENYLFQQLMRQGAGVNHIDHRIGSPIFTLEEEGLPPGMEITIGECESLPFATLFGVDLTEEFPVIWLRLKKAINQGASVRFVGHYAPEIARHLDKTILHRPGNELESVQAELERIKKQAANGAKGAIFVGSQYLNSPHRNAVLKLLYEFQTQLPHLSLNLLEGRGNSVGARYAGMRPDCGPMGHPVEHPGLNAKQVLDKAVSRDWDFLYVAGANPALKFSETLWHQARRGMSFLVVQDLFLTETAKDADVVLPTLSFVEKTGSFINIEGRIQQMNPGKAIPNHIYSDGEIFSLIAMRLGIVLKEEQPFIHTLGQTHIDRKRVFKTGHRPHEDKDNGNALKASFSYQLFDEGVRMQHKTHVSKLAKEPFIRISPKDGQARGVEDGDPVTLSAENSAVQGKVRLDATVCEGVVVIPLGFKELKVHNLNCPLVNGLSVHLNAIAGK